MDNKNWLEVNQAEAIEKAKVVVIAWLKTEEGKNAILDAILESIEMEGSIKVKDDKKVELGGKITTENVKLVAEKKTEKAGIEAEATTKAEDKEKAKTKYIQIYSNQLAKAKVEREDKLKAEENIMLGFEKKYE